MRAQGLALFFLFIRGDGEVGALISSRLRCKRGLRGAVEFDRGCGWYGAGVIVLFELVRGNGSLNSKARYEGDHASSSQSY